MAYVEIQLQDDPANSCAGAPSGISSTDGKAWRDCVAEFRAAHLAMRDAEDHADAVEASCKLAYGKIAIPPGLRDPFAKAMGWFDMSIEELYADMVARRGGVETPRLREIVKEALKGVPAFKLAQVRTMAPKYAAWKAFDEVEQVYFAAVRRLRGFEVANVAELAEKMAIATEIEDEWLMESAVSDAERLAGNATDPHAAAWIGLWRDLGCDFGTMHSGGKVSAGEMIPETGAIAKMNGLPTLPDAPPHLHIGNADEWRGAIKALRLLRERQPDLDRAVWGMVEADLLDTRPNLSEPAGTA